MGLTIAITEAATAVTPRGERASNVDAQFAAIELLTVEGLNRFLGFFIRAHFDEAESARATSFPVGDDFGIFHRAGAGEELLQGIVSRDEGDSANIEFCVH